MEVIQVDGKVMIPCVFTGECTREDEGPGCGTCPDYFPDGVPKKDLEDPSKKDTRLDIISRYPAGLVGVIGFTKEELILMLTWFDYINEAGYDLTDDKELRDKIRGIVKEMEGD